MQSLNLRLSVLSCWLLCVMLVASSSLKAYNPFPAITGLEWIGLSMANRLAFVDVLSTVELVMAGVLSVGYSYRPVQYLTCIAAGSLAFGHGLSVISGGGGCGCFGGIAVPDWLTFAVLALGFSGALHLSRRPRRDMPRRIRLACLGLVIVAGGTMAWVHRTRAPEQRRPVLALVTAASLPEETDALFVVGSWDCEHCRKELRRIDSLREASQRLRRLRILMVIREPLSEADDAVRALPWLELVHVEERLWWSLIGASPPSFVRVRPGEEPLPPQDRWSL